jgi:hypothetical protein
MKALSNYLLESMQELYHFTNAYNLVAILKDDTWIASNDYDKELYISTTRMKYGDTGYPTELMDDTNVVRVVFDGNKLNSKYKIKPVDKMRGKWMAIKANWAQPEKFDGSWWHTKKQTNVEAEDRVFINATEVKGAHKYIKAIHVNLSNIDNKYLKDIVMYCKQYNIELKQYKNDKDFNIGR